MIGNCFDCKFWDKIQDTRGRCRRHAPRPVNYQILDVTLYGKDSKGNVVITDMEVEWPITSDDDGCAEWGSRYGT